MIRGTLPALLALTALAAGCQSTPDAPAESPAGCVARAEGQCPEGQFCETAPNLCHADDAAGTCVDPPGICTREYRPVCGCDNTTYGNDCERRSAGVALNHLGPCLE